MEAFGLRSAGGALASLIGRERELAEAGALLRQPATRLLVLTGPGGVGKTRLAFQLALDAADAFPDGVRVVELAAVADPALVLPTIAQALGALGGAADLAQHLAHTLGDKRLLLVLDNFEQVADAAPDVVALLAACPRLTALVTSRSLLRVGGERVLPVRPLLLPDTVDADDIGRLQASDAVHLFEARARDSQPNFALTEENAAAVVGICRRLDGLPLAIELAVARLRIFSPEALLARLNQSPSLALLAEPRRDVAARHRALRDAIAWSYDLLTPDEQALFRRLAVFRGGFTLDAAEWVMGAVGEGREGAGPSPTAPFPVHRYPSPDVLGGLDALLAASLLTRVEESGGEPRFAMLETVREFADERLRASGEEEVAHRAHATFYTRLAVEMVTGPLPSAATALEEPPTWDPIAHLYRAGGEAIPQIWGPEQGRLLDLLERENANLRATLDWVEQQGDSATELGLCWALWWFWQIRGHLAEGRRRMKTALAATDAPPLLRAIVLFFAGTMAWVQGDDEDARRLQ